MKEMVRIFTDSFEPIGIKYREDVHRDGDWHEVFHCWVIEERESIWWMYLQRRSLNKKDYPGDFDITAAGHLEAQETVHDGVREVEEELGITVRFEDLISLGVISYSIQTTAIFDQEFAHVFLLKHAGTIDDFNIQEEELDGLYATKLSDFLELISKRREFITIQGYELKEGNKIASTIEMRLEDMGALPDAYLHPLHDKLIQLIQ